MSLDHMAVMTTAWRRPYYFQESLASWQQARRVKELALFAVALAGSHRVGEQLQVIGDSGLDAEIWPDRVPGMGPHRAIAEAARRAFGNPAVDFLVFGEEDVLVSDDVLEYMAWAEERFRDDPRVLCVLAHSVGGQGWDVHEPVQDAGADQQQVRLAPYFNAWCWGTWRDRWQSVLEPTWDWNCDSGDSSGPSGYDWNIAVRVIPRHGLLAVVPDASRSQNIGRVEGVYSNEWSFAFAQCQSFREHRDPATYAEVTG
jgi:hypothetical protein